MIFAWLPEPPPEIPLGPVAKEIKARGYRAQKRTVPDLTSWERYHFRMREKVVVAFKAQERLPNENEDLYVRFTLTEQTFYNGDDAYRRLSELHDPWYDIAAEDPEYDRVLRDGFVVDGTVYILETDDGKFLPEVLRLTKELAAARGGTVAEHYER